MKRGTVGEALGVLGQGDGAVGVLEGDEQAGGERLFLSALTTSSGGEPDCVIGEPELRTRLGG